MERDCVLDGELVVWNGERLDFGALQQHMINSAATIRRQLAPKRPASYVAFDLLAIDQVDIRMMRLSDRQRRLISFAQAWRPPLQVDDTAAVFDGSVHRAFGRPGSFKDDAELELSVVVGRHLREELWHAA